MTDEDGWTALVMAAMNGHESVVSMLLADSRTDPHIFEQYETSALEAKFGKDRVQWLLEAKEDGEDADGS